MGLRWSFVAVMAVSLMAASCGTPPQAIPDKPAKNTEASGTNKSLDEPTTTTAISAPVWRLTDFGAQDAPAHSAAAAIGENLVVMTTTDQKLTAWVSAGDRWLPAEIDRKTQGSQVRVEAMGAVPGGVLAVVNYHMSPAPELWFSADGSSWAQLATDGIDHPATVNAVTASDTAVLLTGKMQAKDGSCCGPYAEAIWRSEDLTTWTIIDANVRGDIVAVDSDLLVAGAAPHHATLWRSVDDGRTWLPVPAPEVGPGNDRMFFDVASGGASIIAVGSIQSPRGRDTLVVVRSTDNGNTWSRQKIDTEIFGELEGTRGKRGGFQVQWAGGRFWITANRWFDPWEDPGRCYVDLASCQAFSESVVLRSEDGITWAEIDFRALDRPQYLGLHNVVDGGDGVFLLGSAENLRIWSWQSDATPPLLSSLDVRETLDSEMVPDNAELLVETTYRYPLHIHCGMDYLGELNDLNWFLTDAPYGNFETGSWDRLPDPSWPVVAEVIFGFITLVDESTIEYTIGDGDVIAVYQPSSEHVPGCD